jgi:hypothetical protein
VREHINTQNYKWTRAYAADMHTTRIPSMESYFAVHKMHTNKSTRTSYPE